MLTAARRARHRFADDSGFSLIEVLVAMIIASVVGAMSLAWFMSASDATNSASDADQATAQARNVLQTWAKMLQLAGAPAATGGTTNGIVSLSPTTISFTAYLTNSGACSAGSACSPLTTKPVTLSLSGGMLREAVGSGASTSVVESSTTTAVGSCLFTAYTATGSLGCSSSLTATQLASITSVVLSFKVATTNGHTRSFQTTAAFTN
jgi:prepilin-type N-terminal cleavage/methylation domain-containing protein